MNTQPEALRLANELESYIGRPVCTESAAELRRKHVFLLTRFLSHQVDERYRGSPNLQRIPGGVSELRETLTRISREGQLA